MCVFPQLLDSYPGLNQLGDFAEPSRLFGRYVNWLLTMWSLTTWTSREKAARGWRAESCAGKRCCSVHLLAWTDLSRAHILTDGHSRTLSNGKTQLNQPTWTERSIKHVQYILPALVLLVFRTNHPKNSWLTGHDDLSRFSLTSLLPLACELQRDKRRFLQFVSIYQLNSCISGAGKEKNLWFVLSFSSLFPFQPCGCERTSHPVAHSGPTQLTELSPPSGWAKVTQKTNRSCLVTYSFGLESVKRVTAPHNPECSAAWLLLGWAAASSQWDVS